MSAPDVVVTDDGAVRTVTLNRPHRLNAFTAATYRALADALAAAGTDVGVAVVVLLGAGRSFSSGVDLEALAAAEDAGDLRSEFDTLVCTLAGFPKPLLAAVQGSAVGFGMTLLLHADVVLAADDARFRPPFTALGTAPEAASSWLLPRLVGYQRAAELLFTSRWVSAAEAVDLHLVARRCPPDRLNSEVTAAAQEIAALPTAAVQAAKRLLRADWPRGVRDALDREYAAAAELAAVLRLPDRRGAVPDPG
jgi:enoyl-CoA hydratase/carnithine racemase